MVCSLKLVYDLLVTRYSCTILLTETAVERFSPLDLFSEILQQESIETLLILTPLHTLATEEAAEVVIILNILP